MRRPAVLVVLVVWRGDVEMALLLPWLTVDDVCRAGDAERLRLVVRDVLLSVERFFRFDTEPLRDVSHVSDECDVVSWCASGTSAITIGCCCCCCINVVLLVRTAVTATVVVGSCDVLLVVVVASLGDGDEMAMDVDDWRDNVACDGGNCVHNISKLRSYR